MFQFTHPQTNFKKNTNTHTKEQKNYSSTYKHNSKGVHLPSSFFPREQHHPGSWASVSPAAKMLDDSPKDSCHIERIDVHQGRDPQREIQREIRSPNMRTPLDLSKHQQDIPSKPWVPPWTPWGSWAFWGLRMQAGKVSEVRPWPKVNS